MNEVRAYVDVSGRPLEGQQLYALLAKKENLGDIPGVEVRIRDTLHHLGFLRDRVDIVIGETRWEYAERGTERNGGIPPISMLGDDPVKTLRETIEILLS